MSTPTLRVAYLVSQYPTLSHVFVEREVRALRSKGVEVETFSVRPVAQKDCLSDASRAEAERTVTLRHRRIWSALSKILRASVCRPRGLRRALRLALRSGAPGPRGRLWQLFYLAEALLLADEMDQQSLSHVHAHFANNGADIARLTASLGGRWAEPWVWSFSMHGPTEFANPIGYDLAGKVASAAKVACISNFCRNRLLEVAGPVPAERLPVVRMAVDADVFDGYAGERRRRTRGPARLLFIGRLVPKKAQVTS